MYSKIPKELKQLNRWVCWKLEERKNKLTKVPYNPLTGGKAMSNNSSTWGSFSDAVKKSINYSGIGFMFNGDGIVGVDMDKCRNPETGTVTEETKDIISVLDSYTEFSQSGTGVHVICRGNLPEGKRRKGNVEMYETGRFFVMTGNILDDGHVAIQERTTELRQVHEKYLQGEKKKQQTNPLPQIDIGLDESDIIRKALSAENRDKFSALFHGGWKGLYGSQSEADIALCNMLAFWTGRDARMMDRIFRQSDLYRAKWDSKRGSESYGEMTIQKAIQCCSQVYEPKKSNYKSNDFASSLPPEAPLPEIPPPDITTVTKPEKYERQDTTSDLGRSKIFSEKYKDVLRWCGDMKCWLVWNGKYWESDRTLQVIQFAKETVDLMIFEAGRNVSKATGEEEVKKAKQAFKDTIKAKSERSIKAMVELAKSDLPIIAQQLDQDPYLFNCQNGVVNLRTGQLFPHKQDYYMTKIAGANYETGREFKKFGGFLKEITCNDDELADYFQQICGMAAVGKVFYEGMCIFYGSGRNGKSTFLNLISKTFGDYACSINPEVLMSQKDGRQITGGVSVEGKRFVTAMEMEEGRRLSSSMLKKLASTDPITERPLYQNERTFLPSHTLIMATNFLPKVSSTDAGTWRRIAVVPFRATFDGKKEIKDYASMLFANDADAILTWIIEGAQKYIRNGHNIVHPEAVEAATKQYRDAEDWINNFLQECCEKGEYEEAGGKLYETYKDWCAQNNESYVRRSRDFALQLELQGFEKRRTMKGVVWMGLRLLDNGHTTSLSKYKYEKNKQTSILSSLLDEDELDEFTRKHM